MAKEKFIGVYINNKSNMNRKKLILSKHLKFQFKMEISNQVFL